MYDETAKVKQYYQVIKVPRMKFSRQEMLSTK